MHILICVEHAFCDVIFERRPTSHTDCECYFRCPYLFILCCRTRELTAGEKTTTFAQMFPWTGLSLYFRWFVYWLQWMWALRFECALWTRVHRRRRINVILMCGLGWSVCDMIWICMWLWVCGDWTGQTVNEICASSETIGFRIHWSKPDGSVAQNGTATGTLNKCWLCVRWARVFLI